MTKYHKGQFVKVKVTGIQPYGAFVETLDHVEGLIHISEVMNDYIHNLNVFLSVGQIVKAKVLDVSADGKLNLTLKENDYFRRQERKKKRNLFWMKSIRNRRLVLNHCGRSCQNGLTNQINIKDMTEYRSCSFFCMFNLK